MKKYLLLFLLFISSIYSNNKIYLNSASETELSILPLTDVQIYNLIEYRQLVGQINNIYELIHIDNLSVENIHELKPMISLKIIDLSKSNLNKNYDYKVSQWLSSEGNSESLSESWLDRYFQPMNVNDMSYDDLMSLPNVSPLDAVAILKQKDRGEIHGTFQLKNSPGISRWGYKNLRDFISYKTEKSKPRFHFTSLVRTVPITSSPDSESATYIASNHTSPELLSKLSMNFNNNIQAGVLFHRNMSEATNIQTHKASLGINNYKLGPIRIDKLILGNFNASFAQGVVFESGDDFSPRRSGYGFSKRISGIEQDLTRSAQYVLNGTGIQLSNKYFRGIFFASFEPRDAIINSDGSFSSLIVMKPRYEFGLTGDSSIVHESMVNAVNEMTWGGHTRITPKTGINIGFSYYESLYDLIIDPQQLGTIIGGPDPSYSGDDSYLAYMTNSADPEVAAMYSFTDLNVENKFWDEAKSIRSATGFDFTTVLGKAVFQAEYGELLSEGKMSSFGTGENPSAIVASIYSDLDVFNFLALYRNYDLHYDNPYQRSFSNYNRYKTSILEDTYWLNDPAYGYLYSGNPQPQAEEGLYLSSRYQFHRYFILTLNWDNWNRKADNTKYYRIVSSVEWRPNFNCRIKLRQKWQARGRFNIYHPSPFESRETIITAKLNLSDFNRLELMYIRGNTTFAPRPRLTDSAIGGSMTVGNIGSPETSLGFNFTFNYANNLSVKLGTIIANGFIWFFEDTDFRIISSDNPKLHNWVSLRAKPNANITAYFKISKSAGNINTQITSAQNEQGIWIHNPQVTNNSYDYKLQFDYAF